MPIKDIFREADTDVDTDSSIRNFFIYLSDQKIENSNYDVRAILAYIKSILPNGVDCYYEEPEENESRIHLFYISILDATDQGANDIIKDFSSKVGIEEPELLNRPASGWNIVKNSIFSNKERKELRKDIYRGDWHKVPSSELDSYMGSIQK